VEKAFKKSDDDLLEVAKGMSGALE
jgi:hypothetical protein